MESAKPSYARAVFAMMMNPKSALTSYLSGMPWLFAAIVSGLAFGLFFAQTALDLYNTGQKAFSYVLLATGAGLAYGIIVISLIGALAGLILKAAGNDKPLKWTVATFCLSYSGALIYGILGLIFSLAFGWRTAVAFGITGVLWATGPMMITIRELTGGKTGLAVIVSTLISCLVLASWSLLSQL